MGCKRALANCAHGVNKCTAYRNEYLLPISDNLNNAGSSIEMPSMFAFVFKI